jgi:hypothetical protein
VEATIAAAVERLGRLADELDAAAPERRRALFQQVVQRIDLRFAHVPQGKKVARPLPSGEIHLRTGEGKIFDSVSRENRTAIELFIAGIRGWEPEMRQRLDKGKSRLV